MKHSLLGAAALLGSVPLLKWAQKNKFKCLHSKEISYAAASTGNVQVCVYMCVERARACVLSMRVHSCVYARAVYELRLVHVHLSMRVCTMRLSKVIR